MPPKEAEVTEPEKLRKLSELQRRLAGQQLCEDFTNGAPDALLLRFLAARAFDVDKALAVRLGARAPRPPRPAFARRCRLSSPWHRRMRCDNGRDGRATHRIASNPRSPSSA
jgi:hypothetical protein